MAIRTQIVVCGGTGCMSSHAKEIKDKFDEVMLSFLNKYLKDS